MQDALGILVHRRQSWQAFRAEAQKAGLGAIVSRLDAHIARLDHYLAEHGVHPAMLEPTEGVH